jgi:hypothetical protein
MADTEVTLAPDPVEPDDPGDLNIDDLAGEELYEIPEEFQETEGGTPAEEPKSTAAKAPPGDGSEATRLRDEKTGKFISKDEAPGATAPEPGQPPATDPAQAAEPQPGDQPADTAVSEPEPELEFSFRADGESIPIKGSRVTKDGIFIPTQYAPDVQRLLSYGVTYKGSFRQRLEESARREAETKAQVQEQVVKAEAYLEHFADILDRTEAGEVDDLGRTPLEAWAADFAKNRVKLEAEATLAVAKAYQDRNTNPVKPAKLEGFDDEPEQDPGIDVEELSQTVAAPLGEQLASMVQAEPTLRGLTGSELTRIRDYMIDPKRLDQFYARALEDIPAAEWGGTHDIKKGQIVALQDNIREQLRSMGSMILDTRKEATALAQAVAKNNGSQRPANQIPPVSTVNGKQVPRQPSVQKTRADFKTREDFDAWFNSNDGDPATS